MMGRMQRTGIAQRHGPGQRFNYKQSGARHVQEKGKEEKVTRPTRQRPIRSPRQDQSSSLPCQTMLSTKND
jgi:hypothetical protein